MEKHVSEKDVTDNDYVEPKRRDSRRESQTLSEIILRLASRSETMSERIEPEDRHPTLCFLCKNFIHIYWRYLFTFAWPLLCSPICIGKHMEAPRETRNVYKCIYILLVVTGFWTTQCIPIYMTGFIPCFMFPFMDIMPSSLTNASYFRDLNMMIFCSMIMILSLESTGVHTKIGLIIIKRVGVRLRMLHFLVMSAVFFLSFWIPNAILTIMFCPIIKGIIKSLEELQIENFCINDLPGSSDNLMNIRSLGNITRSVMVMKSSHFVKSKRYNITGVEKLEIHDIDKPTSLTKGYYLGLAYIASIGGAASLIGSGINIHYKETIDMVVPNNSLDFSRWFLCNLPLCLILFGITWVWLQIRYFGLFRKNTAETLLMLNIDEYKEMIQEDLDDKYVDMQELTWDQWWMLILYVFSLVLWFTKGNIFYKGWTHLFLGKFEERPYEYIRSSASYAIIVFLIFIIPNEGDGIGLVQWPTIQGNMRWGLTFIIGGCFTIGTGVKESTLVAYLQNEISSWTCPKFYVQVLVTLLGAVMTEIMSNSVTTLVFQPMVFNISQVMKLNPMYLGNVFTTMLAFPFVLPNGSPANNIVVAYANIQTIDMLITGIPLKIVAFVLTIGWYATVGSAIWNDHHYTGCNTTSINVQYNGLKEFSDL